MIATGVNWRHRNSEGIAPLESIPTECAARLLPSRIPLSLTAAVVLAISFGFCGGYLDLGPPAVADLRRMQPADGGGDARPISNVFVTRGLYLRPMRSTLAAILSPLSQRRKDCPFFAFLNYFDAHARYIPPAGSVGRFGIRPVSADYKVLVVGKSSARTLNAGPAASRPVSTLNRGSLGRRAPGAISSTVRRHCF